MHSNTHKESLMNMNVTLPLSQIIFGKLDHTVKIQLSSRQLTLLPDDLHYS